MSKQRATDKWHRFFRTTNGEQEFMYYTCAKTKAELKPHIKAIKQQGDLYRITKYKGGYELWDSRK